jgi:hypothetical protein
MERILLDSMFVIPEVSAILVCTSALSQMGVRRCKEEGKGGQTGIGR